MFPPEIVGGRYMRDDVIAAFNWIDHFNRKGTLTHLGTYRERPQMIVSEALIFIPADEASRPLNFIQGLFDWRASLPKNDMRGQVIKLGINSVYGKFAQRVGKPGEPPAYGSLWYAAAITAGTRRKLMEAALTDPKGVIAFATDAVFSTRPLTIHVPERKILGEWEFEGGAAGSFVQSGVYTIRKHEKHQETGKPELKTASRGFSPKGDSADVAQDFADALDEDLFIDVPSVWRAGGDTLEFKDQTYIGLGASLASPKTYPYLGYWKTYRRELRVNSMSAKRIVPYGVKVRAKRADGLIDLIARPYTVDPTVGLRGTLTESAPSIPDWMPTENRPKRRRSRGGYDDSGDSENVDAGLSSEVEF